MLERAGGLTAAELLDNDDDDDDDNDDDDAQEAGHLYLYV